ncbi:lipoyl(octanoyl) transferase LipB [Sodalis-like secondary symbiont of Drepanosiphum platanoidis]|uniref:lipoyl(octanoyl) transferase LipB n=1 Tax=Sodalis-like secondary symbiont of Drepanosiphum platanoidis TaxID=2994493 RepID=UPI00346410A9
MKNLLIFRNLGLEYYSKTIKKMYFFTKNRNYHTNDEIWFVQHPKVFTQGRSCNKNDNINYYSDIPIYKSNRGGKITYHGPGQQIIYFMIDLRRFLIKIRTLLNILEKIIISTLLDLKIISNKSYDSPGIYVNKKKICFFGLQIINGCSLYGLSLNVCMDLKPFSYINPCGQINLKITQIKDFKKNIKIKYVQNLLLNKCLFFLKN